MTQTCVQDGRRGRDELSTCSPSPSFGAAEDRAHARSRRAASQTIVPGPIIYLSLVASDALYKYACGEGNPQYAGSEGEPLINSSVINGSHACSEVAGDCPCTSALV